MPLSVVIFILLSTLIVFGFISTMKFLDIYRRAKLGEGGGSGVDNSLGTGELRGLIQEAVVDAIQPVEDRLEQMEMALRQFPEAKSESAPLREPAPEPLPDESVKDLLSGNGCG